MAAGVAAEHSIPDRILLPEEVRDNVFLKNGKTQMYYYRFFFFLNKIDQYNLSSCIASRFINLKLNTTGLCYFCYFSKLLPCPDVH